jgi:hypothetical protein
MTATTPDNDSPEQPRRAKKHRPDGTTPEPETDGLNELFSDMTGTFVDVFNAVKAGEFAMALILARAYAGAELRTKWQTDERSYVANYDDQLRLNLRSVLASFGVPTNLSDVALINRAYDAHRLTTEFANWCEPLQTVEVTMQHAGALLRHANKVPEDRRDEYSGRVLDFARTATVGQTETFAKKLAAELGAAEFEETCEREYAERRVTIEDLDFGMSVITATVRTGEAHALYDLLTKQAIVLRDEHRDDAKAYRQRVREAANTGTALSTVDAEFVEDPRTLDQIRADLFIETILTATPQSILESHTAGAARITANVSIVIPVMSLLNPHAPRDVATIDGMNPMSMVEAREIAGTATCFHRLLTDPITGHALTVDTRKPTAEMRRFLQARDQTCIFPGCRRPAPQSELDHTRPWAAGGKTSVNNMAHLCVRHHTLKHQKPWRCRHKGNGEIEWIPPYGETITVEPARVGPVFKPVEDPPPF